MATLIVTLPTVAVVVGTATSISATSTISNAVRVYLSVISGNTSNVYIGDANVKASTNTGLEVVKGTTLSLSADAGELIDLRKIFIDGTTAGDKVAVTYLAKV